jgi:DNA-binding transcriptional MerR regulator
MPRKVAKVQVGPDGRKLYPTGHVMKQGGVSRQQIYQYTAMGLIKEASRDRDGYRLYPEEVFRQLSLIRGLQALGYSLRDMKQIFWRRQREDAGQG